MDFFYFYIYIMTEISIVNNGRVIIDRTVLTTTIPAAKSEL